jgi:hypothetical protein
VTYYVYENWHRKRTLVHRSSCSHCKYGQGTQPHDSGINGKWHGPFDSKGAAVALMQSFGYSELGLCKVCNP